jgi:glycosyltransferase involved in cell wall biosynthesis
MTAQMRRVVVSHPGRQHSHQAATALERAGMLAAYWAGVPSRPRQLDAFPDWIVRRLPHYAPIDVPDSRARWLPRAVVLRRLARVLPERLEQAVDLFACRAFDRQVAGQLAGSGAAAVLACEISALDTFRAAKKLAMTTVLDAASVHHAVQDRVAPAREPAWLHDRIVAVKQAEVALADHVLTVSEFARAGYLDAGVPEARVHAVPLGADTRLFSPGAAPTSERSAPFTFLFVGATLRRKGIDILFDAFARLRERSPGKARLLVVGPRGDTHELLDGGHSDTIAVYPKRAQTELRDVYRTADCLVLPSRHESFGMTVIEALACGLPAIVSEMVGAREAIDEGVSGWIVPVADAEALAKRMAWCVENRAALGAMRPAARAAAERYDWDRYAKRLTEVMTSILSERR